MKFFCELTVLESLSDRLFCCHLSVALTDQRKVEQL